MNKAVKWVLIGSGIVLLVAVAGILHLETIEEEQDFADWRNRPGITCENGNVRETKVNAWTGYAYDDCGDETAEAPTAEVEITEETLAAIKEAADSQCPESSTGYDWYVDVEGIIQVDCLYD